MANSTTLPNEKVASYRRSEGSDPPPLSLTGIAVSWGAITAGAAAAAALSLILLILGMGLGLSSVSPWSGESMQAGTFGVSTIAWLTLTQLLASALGGYLAGRLRVRWEGVHRDEVYFRDTAHGFLAWAVASLATAALLTSAIGSILGVGVQAGATAMPAAVEATADARTRASSDRAHMGYFIDTLFRRDLSAPVAGGTEAGEVGRIFEHATRAQPLPPEDLHYVAQLVAQRTGLTPPDAEKRVAETYARAQAQWSEADIAIKDAADKARKTSAYGALWLFISLLVGAFVASWAATFGGQQRDN